MTCNYMKDARMMVSNNLLFLIIFIPYDHKAITEEKKLIVMLYDFLSSTFHSGGHKLNKE